MNWPGWNTVRGHISNQLRLPREENHAGLGHIVPERQEIEQVLREVLLSSEAPRLPLHRARPVDEHDQVHLLRAGEVRRAVVLRTPLSLQAVPGPGLRAVTRRPGLLGDAALAQLVAPVARLGARAPLVPVLQDARLVAGVHVARHLLRGLAARPATVRLLHDRDTRPRHHTAAAVLRALAPAAPVALLAVDGAGLRVAGLRLHQRGTLRATSGHRHNRARQLPDATSALHAALALLPLSHLAVHDQGVLALDLEELLTDGLDTAKSLRAVL